MPEIDNSIKEKLKGLTPEQREELGISDLQLDNDDEEEVSKETVEEIRENKSNEDEDEEDRVVNEGHLPIKDNAEVPRINPDDLPEMEEESQSGESINKSEDSEVKGITQKKNDNVVNISQKDDVFSNMDLESIEITDKNPLDQFDDFKEVFSNDKSTFQVGAIQSGYIANMSALDMGDINKLITSSQDAYNERKSLYKTIYDHVENTSVGKITFNDWLKLTSYDDIQTLLFGLYAQTFPDTNKFNIQCPECGEQVGIEVDNNMLIQTEGEGITDKMRELLKQQHESARELLEKSLVHSTERVRLPESNVILDITTPSLNDHLKLLSQDSKLIENNASEASLVLFTKKILIPDYKASRKKGRPVYSEVTQFKKKIQILKSLGVKDGKAVNQKFAERSNRYKIDYAIKNYECPNCQSLIDEIPVDLETALFTQIVKVYDQRQ
jgi:hypothetical protein